MNRRGSAREGRQSPPARRVASRRRKEIPAILDLTIEEALPSVPHGESLDDQPESAAGGTRSAEPGASLGPDRRRLQAEMIEMWERYREGAVEAAANLEKFDDLSARVKTLLDEEFPGWESEPDEQRSDMITLYFQYRADAERAAGIQEKFSRLTRDIEMLLSEEFPDWQP